LSKNHLRLSGHNFGSIVQAIGVRRGAKRHLPPRKLGLRIKNF